MLGLFRRHDHLSPAWLQAGVSRLKGGGRAGKGAPLLDLPDSLLCHIYGRAPARVCAHLAVCKRFASCLLRAESVELRVASANGADVTAASLQRFSAGVSLTAKCCHGVLTPVLAALEEGWSALTSLDLSDNSMGDEGASALSRALLRNTNLTALSLGENALSPCGAASVAAALPSFPRLAKLSLAGNRILAPGATGLAKAISASSLPLTSLSFSGGSIGPAGAAEVGAALIPKPGAHPTLTKLDLSACELRAAGVQALVPALQAHPNLRVLSLSRNEMEFGGATALAGALGTCLEELNLNFNDLGPSGAAALAPCLHLAQGLTQLKLFGNCLGSAGAKELLPVVRASTSLTSLYLSLNNIDGRIKSEMSGTVRPRLKTFHI